MLGLCTNGQAPPDSSRPLSPDVAGVTPGLAAYERVPITTGMLSDRCYVSSGRYGLSSDIRSTLRDAISRSVNIQVINLDGGCAAVSEDTRNVGG